MSDSSTYYTPRRLAKHLRDARVRAGVSQTEIAERMKRTQSWVSLIERGQISLTPDVVERWCDALGLENEDRSDLVEDYSRESDKYISWRMVWADGVERVQRERGELEQRSKRLRIFQSTFVHSLLQTPQYVEAIYHATRFFPDDSLLTEFMQGRLARQAVLHDSKKQIDAVMTEAALRYMIGTPEVMAAQMEHLAKLSERQMINLAVLPSNEPLPVLPHNNWDLFGESVVIVEIISGQVAFTEPHELALYLDTFELLRDDAIVGEDAEEFLWSLAREYESASPKQQRSD